MSKINGSTLDLIKSLIKLREYRLAIETGFVNSETELLAREGRKLKKKIARHNARTEAHMKKVEEWPDYLAKSILDHKK